jgi:hypothetical protein
MDDNKQKPPVGSIDWYISWWCDLWDSLLRRHSKKSDTEPDRKDGSDNEK